MTSFYQKRRASSAGQQVRLHSRISALLLLLLLSVGIESNVVVATQAAIT
jgi:hypothetical protein